MNHNKLKGFLPILIIFFIGLTIYFTNLSGNFWLTGWDNLHPEFNLKLNIERSFFSSWQEYQGLGLPAGNGHASEFFREIILAGLSFLVSLQSIRKIYLLLMLIAGPIGIYIFLNNVVIKEDHGHLKSIASLFGALFYLLHIATVQIFYLPFEAFITFYGVIPWMIYSIYKYAQSPTKKSLFFVFIIHLLGSSMFFIPTLFIVYTVLILIISLDLLKITGLRKILKAYSIILISNLFWLLPFLYYSIINISSQLNAYLNLLYSGDLYLKNVAYGGFLNSLLIKGFLFGTTDQINPKNYDYLMVIWRDYFANPVVIFMALVLSFVFIIGIINSLKKRSNYAFILIFILFFSLIAIDTVPFNFLNEIFRKIPLFDQIFRNPFTKFANILLFVESIFFAIGVQAVITFCHHKLKKFPYFIVGIIFLMQFFVVLPIWQGHFIYSNLKLSIPSEYFDLFDYFKSQGDGRIANFPQPTPNGWEVYNWGYRGSGFLWYGIKQPILDRAFDVWDKNSENYYWEIYKATYSDDSIQVNNVLNKYHIRWLLIDNNVIGSTSTQTIDYDKFKKLLDGIPEVQYVTSFGKIDLYQVRSTIEERKYIEVINNSIPNIFPEYKWNDNDVAFNEFDTYLSSSNDYDKTQIYYPFRSIFTGRGNNEDGLNITEYDDSYILETIIPAPHNSGKLIFPKLKTGDFTEYDKNDLLKTKQKIPDIFLNEKPLLLEKDFTKKQTIINIDQIERVTLKVKIPKILGYNSFDSNTNNGNYLRSSPKNCDRFQHGTLSKKTNLQNQVELTSLNSGNCFDIDVPSLTHKNGYLLAVKSQNIEGKSILFTFLNKSTNTIDLQTHLESTKDLAKQYFIISPKSQYGLGFRLYFDNYSFGNRSAVNIFDSVTINQIPYDFLTGIKIIKNEALLNPNNDSLNINVNHPDYSLYEIDLSKATTNNNSTVILYQSYSPGWMALDNGKILPHFKINNWANGWRLDTNSEKITLIYWPQYLEFLGFGLLILALVLLAL